MKSKMRWIVLAIVIVLGLWTVSSYNSFVTLNTGIDGQWAQVENQFQRRFDLIPNLTESVKGIMKQEQAVFTALADARTKYGGAGTVDAKVSAANEVSSALGRLLVVLENYPQLRSSENVSKLMDELAGTENRVAVERQRFNDLTKDYNGAVLRFPGNIVASFFGFKGRPLFEAAEAATEVPKVQF